MMKASVLYSLIVASFLVIPSSDLRAATATLLNVSYDPTREFYQDFNKAFAKEWQEKSRQPVAIQQSHGGSGKQARAVIEGLEADVVTLALAYDIDAIAQKGRLLPSDWQTRFPNHSCPYTSTIVFVVRKGNPKKIQDWNDLANTGISIVTPNPKTSGGARWNYLAAYGYELRRSGGDEAKAKEFVGKVFRNVAMLDSGARGSTVTFLQRGIGDVLIAWENEALLAVEELSKGEVKIIVPSTSILAEPPVAIVDKVVRKHKTEAIARAYLDYLYSEAGQDLAARHYFRPRNEAVLNRNRGRFAKLNLFTIDEVFGGWAKAHKTHFAEGGTFDQIYAPGK